VIQRRRFWLRAAGLAIFMLAFVALVLQLFVYAGGNLTPGHRYEVNAVVPSALTLAPHADVRQAGVRIGKVQHIGIHGSDAVLRLQIDDGHAPVHRDARVLVRTKGQAGGSDYVDLYPGTPAAGRVPSGGELSIAHSSESTQFDQIISTLGPRTRRHLRRLLDSLGEGVGRHGKDLNRFLEGSAALVQASRPVNEVLASDQGAVVSLIDDFGSVTRSLGDRAAAIRVLTRRSKDLAEAVAARDARFRDTLAALPGFLHQTRSTTTRLGSFATSGTPVMRNLRLATDALVPAMRALRPAAAASRRTMRALGRFARASNPMAAHLRPFAAASSRLTPPLDAFLREVNPLAAYLAPFYRETGALLGNLKAATQNYDALGHYARVLGMQSKSNAVGLLTPAEEQAYQALIQGGVLTPIDTRGINPYAKPGGADRIEPWQGTYPRLEADPPYTHR